jgi:drug/metabolite transporter (DMT)-like permease
MTGQKASPMLVWGALWAVYIVWGSTYLAIRVADRTLPPFLMAGARFIVAGALMYGWAVWRGETRFERPTARNWVAATIVGGALCLGGNGLVVWAELHIGSGLAALIVATVPLWFALLDRLLLGHRLSRAAILGLALGFGGLAILVNPSGSHFSVAGVVAVMFAAFFWASGSLYSRTAPLHAKPFVATGMEMIAGGVLLSVVGLASGEAGKLDLAHVGLNPWLGWIYLVVFGSLVGFTAYVWLLRAAPTSLVGTYAYVNPVIAVFLGWLLLHEHVGWQTFVGGAVIVVGVLLIVRSNRPAAGQAASEEPPADVATDRVPVEEGAA